MSAEGVANAASLAGTIVGILILIAIFVGIIRWAINRKSEKNENT
jgi:hypothetical protein